MDVEVEILEEQFNKDENTWETYNGENFTFNAKSVKDAFWKACEELDFREDIIEDVWKNRTKKENQLFHFLKEKT